MFDSKRSHFTISSIMEFLFELVSNISRVLKLHAKMGCVFGKCCSRFPWPLDGDNKEEVDPGQKKHILANRLLEIVNVPSHNFRLEYSVLTQRGHYPETPGEENEDSETPGEENEDSGTPSEENEDSETPGEENEDGETPGEENEDSETPSEENEDSETPGEENEVSETPGKENEDSYCIRTNIQGNPDVHFFGVFDGHGQFGAECSNFVKDRLVNILSNDAALLDDPLKAYSAAFLATSDELDNSDIDDSSSGTTAITALVVGDKLYLANVGDSRAVLAVKEGNKVIAQDLSCDQTPFRADECQRVKLCGAKVLNFDQVEGLKDPGIQSWEDEETAGGDPPRVWFQDEMEPGLAVTRSVGDRLAEKIGVVADPEVSMIQLTAQHPFFVVASDGVFQFLPSQTVVDTVSKYADPRDACSAVAAESYKLWLDHAHRTDDITIILVQIKRLD